MRIAAVLLVFVALLCGGAIAAPSTPGKPAAAPGGALVGQDCLDPSAARSWHYISGNELLVDAGRRKYRITLREMCTELGIGDALVFRGGAISGRVCGNIGEGVRVRGRTCRIDRVELMDDEAFKAATGGKRGTVSATSSKR